MNEIILLISQFLAKNHQKPSVIVLLGQTASGKTALSLKLAKRFNCEIISADSRQVYKEMDIGTDKLPLEKRGGITHHLIDVVKPDEPFSVGDFKNKAEACIAEIKNKGKIPFIVGGTGLYIDALINNFRLYEPQPLLREELQREIREKGNQFLHQRLAMLDPETARKIHPHNTHHLIRALEIALAAHKKKQPAKDNSQYDVLKIGLTIPRPMLYERIDERVEEQIKKGLIEETKNLVKKYTRELQSMSSLGYAQILRYVEGELTYEEAIALLKKNTRHYAKRQLTWFRRDKEIHWFTIKVEAYTGNL